MKKKKLATLEKKEFRKPEAKTLKMFFKTISSDLDSRFTFFKFYCW